MNNNSIETKTSNHCNKFNKPYEQTVIIDLLCLQVSSKEKNCKMLHLFVSPANLELLESECDFKN